MRLTPMADRTAPERTALAIRDLAVSFDGVTVLHGIDLTVNRGEAVGLVGESGAGKTSLVRRLTGVDTDRLKEEKARGISIALGFAYWPQPDGSVVGFIDVPGHERFVHTMLAGAAGIDLLLLVVAADDGVMPQTREHVAIARLLGISEAVVAITKTDLVEALKKAV